MYKNFLGLSECHPINVGVYTLIVNSKKVYDLYYLERVRSQFQNTIASIGCIYEQNTTKLLQSFQLTNEHQMGALS